MTVFLRCRSCRRVVAVDGGTKNWPDCVCGDTDFRIERTASSPRVERAVDDETWKSSLDEYLTNERRRI